jgi:hypothetical protein
MTTIHDEALRDPDLAAFFDDLRDLAHLPAAAPSPALDAVLRATTPLDILGDRKAARAGVIALVAAGVVAAGVGAAAANQLPAPAQRAISSVVNHLTPFHVPEPDNARPDSRIDPARTPAPAASDSGARTRRVEPSTTVAAGSNSRDSRTGERPTSRVQTGPASTDNGEPGDDRKSGDAAPPPVTPVTPVTPTSPGSGSGSSSSDGVDTESSGSATPSD